MRQNNSQRPHSFPNCLPFAKTSRISVSTDNEDVPETKTDQQTSRAEENAFIALMRTTDALSRQVAQVMKVEDVSLTQYNVLRILRGSPKGLSCGDIGSRMITREPDITRLLERLEKRRLVSRRRAATDPRIVIAHVTPIGLTLLDRLDEPVQRVHHQQLGHLGPKRLKELVELLAVCQSPRDCISVATNSNLVHRIRYQHSNRSTD